MSYEGKKENDEEEEDMQHISEPDNPLFQNDYQDG